MSNQTETKQMTGLDLAPGVTAYCITSCDIGLKYFKHLLNTYNHEKIALSYRLF